jgi:AcrR family transcriptional regulator
MPRAARQVTSPTVVDHPRDPVGTHLIRPTAPQPPAVRPRPPLSEYPDLRAASREPARVVGTRSRAGNAMGRTRRALLAGATDAVARHGTRVTMSEVAACAGVAKATLYNHLRTRDDVLSAVLCHEIERLCEETRQLTVGEALAAAASAISAHSIRRSLAANEPEVIARLAHVDPTADGWRLAAAEVRARLAGVGRGGADTVLRLLASYITSPGDPVGIRADVAAILDGLPTA